MAVTQGLVPAESQASQGAARAVAPGGSPDAKATSDLTSSSQTASETPIDTASASLRRGPSRDASGAKGATGPCPTKEDGPDGRRFMAASLRQASKGMVELRWH